MSNESLLNKSNTKNEVLITHTFNAPRELVFKAWTDPEYLKEWYAPDGCTIHFKKIDIREGGSFHSCISNPAYHDCWCIGEYHQITVPEKIVYTLIIADENGNPISALEAGMDPDWPKEIIVTVTFTEHEAKTTITLHQAVAESIAKRTGAYPSWIKMLVRLESIVNKKEIITDNK